jgi:hypothetical protein
MVVSPGKFVFPRYFESGKQRRLGCVFTYFAVVQLFQWNDGTVFNENSEKLVWLFSPIDHGTGHGCALAFVFSLDEKSQSRVIQETNGGGLSPNVILPMAGIRCYGDQGEHLGTI